MSALRYLLAAHETDASHSWNHYQNEELHNLHDDLLRSEKVHDEVSLLRMLRPAMC